MNRYLLAKYKAHVNVEVIGSVGAVKYLFKYITKGQDRVMVEKQIDEIQEHINCSWYGDTNSFWRLFEFKLTRCSHPCRSWRSTFQDSSVSHTTLTVYRLRSN